MDSIAYQSCKARKKSTACASTPVPRKAPHPAHTATRMCPKNTRKSHFIVWPDAQGCLCCFHRAHRNYAWQLHGSGHTRPLASAKNIQETNTRLHIQARQIGAGAVAARAHRRCLCAYRRQSNVGEARQCCLVYVKMTVCTVGCDRNRMANLSKASNVVQEKYILYDVTGFTQKWHSIPVATNCIILYLKEPRESTRKVRGTNPVKDFHPLLLMYEMVPLHA